MTTEQAPYLNKAMLATWAGPNEFREGSYLFEQGKVKDLDLDLPLLRARIDYGGRDMYSRVKLCADGTIENLCPCRDSRERGIVCSHAVAVGMAYVDQVSDPYTDRRLRIAAKQEQESRLGRKPPLWSLAHEAITASVDASLVVRLAEDWEDRARTEGRYSLAIHVVVEGRKIRPDKLSLRHRLRFSDDDLEQIYLLEDMARGAIPNRLDLSPGLMAQWLTLHRDQFLGQVGAEAAIHISTDSVMPHLAVAADESRGSLILTFIPGLDRAETDDASFLWILGRREGWVYAQRTFRPLDAILPHAYKSLYRGSLTIERNRLISFLHRDLTVLEREFLLDQRFPVDRIEYVTGTPAMVMILSGNHEQLDIDLKAEYGGVSCIAGYGSDRPEDFSAPDPAHPFRYQRRNMTAERTAIQRLPAFGLPAECGNALPSVRGTRAVMDFLATRVPIIRAEGWRVEFGGWLEVLTRSAEWVIPHLELEHGQADQRDFLIRYEYRDQHGERLPADLAEAAYVSGESFFQQGDRTFLIDRDLFQGLHDLLDDCGISDASPETAYKVAAKYSGYAVSSLDSFRGITHGRHALVSQWASRQNRALSMEPIPLNESLANILRPYQKEGVSWLRFLEDGCFGGILADEMGLGKTVQALAWIQLDRLEKNQRGKPSLVVCPTSLVVNWAEESQRFTPALKVHIVAGSDRHKSWSAIKKADLVITSYALLRRDIERYRDVDFAIAILDEAQHIKNHSTQNAKSAKQIRARLRLVLTGTPIENSVSDLWSIMDFLMPGFLGVHSHFKRGYEVPIAAGGSGAAAAHARLHRKIHPFLLRRLKKDVAKELPDKIDRIAHCDMSAEQRRAYRDLLESTSRQLSDLVEAKGFARSRFTVLKTLTRLRQVCCHLDLLKVPGAEYREPSAKLDLFLELLDEAMDSGHRVLVFSQFVSMLQILPPGTRPAQDSLRLPRRLHGETNGGSSSLQQRCLPSVVSDQPQGRRHRLEPHRGGHGHSLRPVVESRG
jgi:hypothetical protein